MKRCPKCKTVKPFDDFHRNRRALDGRQCWCRACIAAHVAAYQAAKRALPLPTAAELQALFDYDPETGALTDETGEIATTPHSGGYLAVSVGGRQFLAHRVIWCMQKGQWPDRKVDHRDRVRDNNRWGNLRLATNPQSTVNSKTRRNKHGFRGVWFAQRSRRYYARITINGRARIVRCDSAEEAAREYDRLAIAAYGTFAKTILNLPDQSQK